LHEIKARDNPDEIRNENILFGLTRRLMVSFFLIIAKAAIRRDFSGRVRKMTMISFTLSAVLHPEDVLFILRKEIHSRP